MAELNGIDVSSNQPAGICNMVPIDFAIVKASGNPSGGSSKWNYKNPYMAQQVNEALSKTGCAGLYHFAYGMDAVQEADFFISVIEPYIGRVIPVLDYEMPFSNKVDTGWVRRFVRRVKEKTGVNCMIYASSSVIQSQGLVALAREENCGLWSANYWKGYDKINGYDTSGMKMSVAESAIWQFTSSGRLSGYNGNLDLNKFFGDKNQWLKYTGASDVTIVPPTAASKSIAELASEVIAGQWGNGNDRKNRLTSAGYDYNAVQTEVNRRLNATSGKSTEELAIEVCYGKHGNGTERKNSINLAGGNYDTVQKLVNEYVTEAKKVARGDRGNMPQRKANVEAQGFNYEAVQYLVNQGV